MLAEVAPVDEDVNVDLCTNVFSTMGFGRYQIKLYPLVLISI